MQVEILSRLSIADLRAELHARQSGRVTALGDVSDRVLVQTLRQFQMALYGTDDRLDLFDLHSPADLADADSVVALFFANDIVDNSDGTAKLQTQSLRDAKGVCVQERFQEQPSGGEGTGVLVAPRIVATAGHLVTKKNVTTLRFVFGYRMRDAKTAQTTISKKEIYRGAAIEDLRLTANGPDWALVRLDREVEGHRVARIRRSGKIADQQHVHVIGHPLGLPAKFGGGAAVRENAATAFFVANLDTYSGNSGSPVFNSDTHEVEGILVRGERDFVQLGSCKVSLVCPTTGCNGEHCTRTTEFASSF